MSPARSGPPFREIWKTWHIYGVGNRRTYGMGNGEGESRLLDGIEDLIRHSMRLRAMSQRALREEQLREGWTNAELVEHLRGDHDDEHQFDDGSVYGQLKYLGAEDEASKFIPEQVLRALRAEYGDAPAIEKRYFANRDDEDPLETTVLAQQGRWFTLRRNEGDGVSFEAEGVLEAIRLHPDLLAVRRRARP